MKADAVHGWWMVSLRLRHIEDYLALGRTCRALRERLLLREEAMRSALPLFVSSVEGDGGAVMQWHFSNAEREEKKPLYVRVVQEWMQRMRPFVHGKPLKDNSVMLSPFQLL